MELLPQEVRDRLPLLYSQESLGGQAIVQVKFFTPDSNWTWWATEGSPEGDDFLFFFGLVEGLDKELGYFCLSELRAARGPLGLSIERDLYWKPKPLCEIAPELFQEATPPQGGADSRTA
jgi:hypothetical protein